MIKTYFSRMAAVWDETAAENDEAKLRLMAERLNIRPGATVLDVGAGTGVFIPFLLSKIGNRGQIVALDVAEEMLRRARAKGFNGMVAYLNADVVNMPLPDETFDSVVCYSSFPHFQDKPKALAEIYRVTRSGGYLFICHTSSRDAVNEIHSSIPEVENDLIPDADEMQIMLARAGFIDIRIEDYRESYLCCARKP
ncbi:MAG TPA: methyltransferase domain-containing protein [Dehalococcoidales bacterium]|nr:methyltransferase domain-containing protein [Dehalococcoidales bacterium]